MDKENDNGSVSMSNGENTLPEGVLGFIVIDQTKKDDNGISLKEEYTISKPIKSRDLNLFSKTLSLPTLNSESVYTLELLQEIDPEAEWSCVTTLTGEVKKVENWKHEGSYIYFNGPFEMEVALLSKRITNNMTVCPNRDVLASIYDDRITK